MLLFVFFWLAHMIDCLIIQMIYLIQIEVRKEVILDKCSSFLVLLFHDLLLLAEYLFESVLIIGFSSAISRHDCVRV